MTGPRQHPREVVIREARLELEGFLLDWSKRHQLTNAEWLATIADVLGRQVANTAKYMIRLERHGDYDTPGGWAGNDT